MSLTYDERSELRMAFEEAYVEPERRRACRIRHKINAKLVPWPIRIKAPPIEVRIEDFSTTGVGLVHARPLRIGAKYLLEVPRPGRSDIWVLLTVVRCLPMDDGGHGAGLEATELVDPSSLATNPFNGELNLSGSPMTTRRRTKILFLLFGIAGTALAAFLNA
jgi:hypothetical protein